MRFKISKNLEKNLAWIMIIPFIDVTLLISMILGMASLLTVNTGVSFVFPKKTIEVFQDEAFEIKISSEDVVYLNGSVATMRELGRKLLNPRYRKSLINVVVDRRASTGRMMDVWNVCRKSGIENIKLITSQ